MNTLNVTYIVEELPPHILLSLLHQLAELFGKREKIALRDLMSAGYTRPTELVSLGWIAQVQIGNGLYYRPMGELAAYCRQNIKDRASKKIEALQHGTFKTLLECSNRIIHRDNLNH